MMKVKITAAGLLRNTTGGLFATIPTAGVSDMVQHISTASVVVN